MEHTDGTAGGGPAAGSARRMAILARQVTAAHFACESRPREGRVDAALVSALQRLLDHDNHDMRARMKDFMRAEVYVPRYDMDLRDERELALARLRGICDAGFVSVEWFRTNPLAIFAAHEIAAFCDPSMATKMTVQFK